MAQLVEHILGKDEVISSNLITSSSTRRPNGLRVFFLSKKPYCFPNVHIYDLTRLLFCGILIYIQNTNKNSGEYYDGSQKNTVRAVVPSLRTLGDVFLSQKHTDRHTGAKQPLLLDRNSCHTLPVSYRRGSGLCPYPYPKGSEQGCILHHRRI